MEQEAAAAPEPVAVGRAVDVRGGRRFARRAG